MYDETTKTMCWLFAKVTSARAAARAANQAVVEFRDTNDYAQVTGGYWPVSWRVGGVEQPQVVTRWPFTDVNPLGATSNTSGIYAWDGSPQTARHTGPYVNINDNCTGAPQTAGSGARVFARIVGRLDHGDVDQRLR